MKHIIDTIGSIYMCIYDTSIIEWRYILNQRFIFTIHMITVYRKNTETPYEAIEGVCINNILITVIIKK